MPELGDFKTIAYLIGRICYNSETYENVMGELLKEFHKNPEVMVNLIKKQLIYNMIKKAWDANDSPEFNRLVDKFIDSHEYMLYDIIGMGTLNVKLSDSLEDLDDKAQNLGSDKYVNMSNQLKLIYDIRKRTKINEMFDCDNA